MLYQRTEKFQKAKFIMYKSTRLIGPSDGSETALFEYNPTILPITEDQETLDEDKK